METIDRLVDRPKEYCNVDGVGELGIGIMCLGFALMGWVQVHTPEHSAWNGMFAFFVFMGVVCSVIHYGTKAIKKHVTFPRTGYVEYRKRDTVWIPMILAFSFSALASAGVVFAIRAHWNLTTAASLVGLFFAACYARGIARTVRWKWAVVALLAASSLVIELLPRSVLSGISAGSWIVKRHLPAEAYGAFWLCLTCFGALTLISGGISFWLYLRHTQAPQ